MLSLWAQFSLPAVTPEAVLSALSAAVTGYFWLIRSRQERPSLKFFQLRGFRTTLRRGDPEEKTRRLCAMQTESPGVLIANNSTRQNSIVRFNCYLLCQPFQLKGHFGYLDDDHPPWNLPPQSTIDIRLACFWDVPEDFEVPENMKFRVEFVTVSGKKFSHTFSLQAPSL